MISSLLFQPPPITFIHPSKHFYLTTSTNSRIPCFYLDNGHPITVLFSHGNAEDLGMIYDWFSDLSRLLHVNIMCYDFTGYGKSEAPPHSSSSSSISSAVPPAAASNAKVPTPPTIPVEVPNEDQVYADIDACYDYLLNVRKLQPEQVVLYGRSLGSGPSCYLAAKTAREGRSVAGLILQSPLLSAFRVAFNFRFTLPMDQFPNIDYAADVRCPVFIVHGTIDEVVPFWHGQELFNAVRKEWRAKPFWVEGAGHNNIEALLRNTGAFVDSMAEFFDLHVPARTGKPIRPVEVPVCLEIALGERAGGEGGRGAS
jgi:pimeloyl-ACP methyl ester carboxylesterase